MKHRINLDRPEASPKAHFTHRNEKPGMTTDMHRVLDPMWSNEGRNDPRSTEASRRALRSFARWLLVCVIAVIVALAFNAGAWQ